ncbi:MAG: hypothetical protein A3D35_03140 [Candidatus Staskawiczbacteria bacterium RIFCSPHIGHO2_02_FULL_34_9]|uniref:histidine kinase n=1 Tax=Candidatus Staskawiczbacteria bacterium RIFCSPHIGHO2_02_FULL_34_9 TaxID=1802206 RepID=A0A1G2I1J1_9BACT|nr:MAG: hypothetical protein A3D35_03140 [Candidatus Staskawiczbacteria bacterium RIFCSPHIGHO2_02_FULL_34_9]
MVSLIPLPSPLNTIFIVLLNLLGVYLSFWVYWANRTEKMNRGFSIMVATILSWVDFYYLAQYGNSTFLFRLATASVFFFFIAYYFFTIRWFLGKMGWYKYLGYFVLIYGFIFGVLTIGTSLVIDHIEIVEKSFIKPIFQPISWWAFYGLVIIITLIINWVLIKEYFNYSSGYRLRILYFLVGLFIFAGFNIIFNVIQPVFFNIYRYYELGNYSVIFLLGFTAYAIVKQELFGIKAILTQTLIIIMAILLLWQTVVAFPNWLDLSWKLILFLSFVLFGIFLDKSVKKEIKQREEIQKLNKELEKAYAFEKKAKEDVGRAFDVEKRANEELQKLDKVKNDFLLTTQHDLRKPLTSVKWFLDMLMKGMLGKQTKKTLEGARNVQISVDDSIEEVNDFLDMAQFQMGKAGIVLKPAVDVIPILDRIAAKMKMRAEQNEVAFTFEKPEKPILVDADPVKFKAALSNVVDNSIKYSPKGKVDMSIALTNGDKNVLITVKDNGIGIPKDKIKSIFEAMFERTEDAKRTTSMGKGIGLPLSTEIIRNHNGKIWAESEGEGKGSTFYIELPVSSVEVGKTNF